MRVPDRAQLSQPWRIHDILGDFPLEDVWRLPEITGTAGEFGDLVRLFADADPARDAPAAVRFLWNARDLIGRWLGLGEIAQAADSAPPDSLRPLVPEDLRGTADEVHFAALPFVPLYLTPNEFAAEIANATMHGVMHLGWIQESPGGYSPQMSVYVRPNGFLGRGYMQFIKPFRYAIVYPALEQHAAAIWRRRSGR